MVIKSFKNYFSEAFKNDLEQLIWQENPMDHGVNQKFLSVLDMHAPIKTVKIKRRLCPFVDQEIVQLMKKEMRCINLPAKPCRPWTGTDIVYVEIKLKENCKNPRERRVQSVVYFIWSYIDSSRDTT